MREVRVFVLRLLVDPAQPKALRGVLQALPEGPAYPFAGGRELLRLLRRLAALRPCQDPARKLDVGSDKMPWPEDSLDDWES